LLFYIAILRKSSTETLYYISNKYFAALFESSYVMIGYMIQNSYSPNIFI